MNKTYSPVGEQFKKILNNEEISRIEDPELRKIRSKHWEYRHKIFIDEQGISDLELCKLMEEDYAREKLEIDRYKEEKI